ncbi:hypothetical protein DUI87_21500 [Hirundo rustica rustica]|uniref:Uncharacterized protein n=1 Tax=Hirundo rustica rustica TaxID=333673 RepID=A0A3M0JMR5_HIRRU|nr:hypothetical protein DUI87_21500 [Hirundo rustica rustica]
MTKTRIEVLSRGMPGLQAKVMAMQGEGMSIQDSKDRRSWQNKFGVAEEPVHKDRGAVGAMLPKTLMQAILSTGAEGKLALATAEELDSIPVLTPPGHIPLLSTT